VTKPKGTFESLLEQDFRWPAVGDRLFVEPAHWSEGAKVGGHTFHRLVMMMDGYKEAADALVDVTASEKHRANVLVYPILFCYRHYIELALKYVLLMYGGLGGVEPNTKDHDLEDLWRDVRRVIETTSSGEEDPDLEAVEAVIAEFAKIDRGSFTFRYPTDKKGQLLEIAVERVDLERLRDTMNGVTNFFMGADGFLDNQMREGSG
jgi:hypothetical protein